ncbi:glycosyltransferase family 4 protein [Thermococcus radiotolerans]|uniref:Glycosyl transferase family 1 domain-containing protein n=1 Tax=Thermococcus radiotolerans TaxID=187880 RepID=A0A2Z2N2J9_9EURY|nr:glycosyltransferase family 4 protein [Thermococcus radiotolerans]ASJ15227.1 hypothetical protein A3L10_08835 [Thermococcus radiotolerans]
MRIVIIHNEMAPYRIFLFDELGKGFKTKVIFGRKKDPKRLWNIPLGKRFRWRVLPEIKVGSYVLNAPWGLFKELKDSDVVVIADNVDIYPLILISVMFTKLACKPLVLWVGHLDTEYTEERKFILRKADEILKRFLYSMGNSFVVYSSKSLNFLVRRGVKPHKIAPGTTQYYPQELLSEALVGKEKNVKKTWRLQALALGYFERRKGFKHLIRALCGMKEVELTLAGSGDYEKTLKEEAEECGNIEFPGYVDGELKAQLYINSDVFVFPTLHDPWGFVVNEAFYYGLPVIITTAAGAVDAVVNGKNGFIVEPGNPNTIREVLAHLVENKKLLRKLKVHAKKSGKKLTDISKGAKTIEKAIKKAIELHE